jgi:hypothetical protein
LVIKLLIIHINWKLVKDGGLSSTKGRDGMSLPSSREEEAEVWQRAAARTTTGLLLQLCFNYAG